MTGNLPGHPSPQLFSANSRAGSLYQNSHGIAALAASSDRQVYAAGSLQVWDKDGVHLINSRQRILCACVFDRQLEDAPIACAHFNPNRLGKVRDETAHYANVATRVLGNLADAGGEDHQARTLICAQIALGSDGKWSKRE